MSIESIYERLGRVEEKATNHDNRIENLEGKNDVLVRLATLMETQVEVNKEQQNQIKEQHQTLVKINENLTTLNSGMQDLNNRVTEIEDNQESKKIDLGQLAKSTILYIIPSLLLTWLLIELGLK